MQPIMYGNATAQRQDSGLVVPHSPEPSPKGKKKELEADMHTAARFAEGSVHNCDKDQSASDDSTGELESGMS